jgi:fucose permease
VALAVLALVLMLTRRAWDAPAREHSGTAQRDQAGEGAKREVGRTGEDPKPPAAGRTREDAKPAPAGRSRRPVAAALAGSLVFIGIETGIESAAGIWGYVFLTSGRGLSHQVAGIAVSAYWAMMFAGRAVLGPVAQRWGAGCVLSGAVAGVAAGAALMAAPGPPFLAVAGLMIVGLAAAPVFPLFTLTTPQRLGGGDAPGATRAVSLQVAASAAGSAALPAGIGLLIGDIDARTLAPALLVLGVAMCALYGTRCRARRPSSPCRPTRPTRPRPAKRRRTRSGTGCCRRDR